jgi:hypothetical protein
MSENKKKEPGYRPNQGGSKNAYHSLASGFAFCSFICHCRDRPEIDWQKVDDAFGRKPAVSSDVHHYGFPRTDLTVTLDGVTIKPALALGGWVAFKPAQPSR